MNKLTRHLRSDRNTNHSHYYNSVNSQNSRNYHPNVDSRTSGNKIGSVELKKISSVNFTEFIWESNKVSSIIYLFQVVLTLFIQILFSLLLDNGCAIFIDSMCILHDILEHFTHDFPNFSR